MPELELSAGIIEYEDTGGSGPVVVLLHGLAMDGSLWRHVVRDLRADHRCIVPTLPLGGHRQAMRTDADLSPAGIGRLEAELLERPERIAGLVITSCEAFENFPPGLPGRAL